MHSQEFQWTTGKPISAEVVNRISKLDPLFPQINQKKCLCGFNLKLKKRKGLIDYIQKYIATVLKSQDSIIFYRDLKVFRTWLIGTEGLRPQTVKEMLSAKSYKDWISYLQDELATYCYRRLGVRGIQIKVSAQSLKQIKQPDQQQFVPVKVIVDSEKRQPALNYENEK